MLVHNFYSSVRPSGENIVIDIEKNLLELNGDEVVNFSRFSDRINRRKIFGLITGALSTPWNPWVALEVRKAIENIKPDVVHVHNTFPLISPSIFSAIGQRAARVLTLHNYRLLCPAAIPMRDGQVCTECIDGQNVLPSLRHGCYRGSRLATVPLAANVALHRHLGTWRKHVDAFIALSDFQRERMADGGLPAHKIHVKPNFYPGQPTPVPWAQRGDYVVFAGRLGAEKGVRSLLKAWQQWGESAPELRLVGDGELRAELEQMAVGLPVRFLGQLPSHEAQAQIANARLLVLPSECFEGFPMVVREAFAFGTPVAVSKLGPLPSIVLEGRQGVLFEPGAPAHLRSQVQTVWADDATLMRLGQGAHQAFLDKYTEEANYQQLMSIYAAAIEQNKQGH